MKKLVIMITVLALLISTLAGCSGSKKSSDTSETSETTKAEVTQDTTAAAETNSAATDANTYTGAAPITTESGKSIKILAQTSNYTNVDIANAEIVKKVISDAGISVDWQLVDNANYKDSVSPMLSTGSIDADIILLPDQDSNQIYLKSGLFAPLDSYFDVMPNFTAWLDKNPIIKAELTAEDGHIYYVPGTNVGKDYQPVLMFNQVWLDAAGKTAPTTLEDFVDLLRYYKSTDMNGNGQNDEIPMSIMSGFLPFMFGPAFGLDLVSGFQADEIGNVTYTYADSTNYKKYLEFLNGLYEEGLLEVEYSTLTRDQVIERMSNDLTGVAYDYSWAMSMMYSNVLPYYDNTAKTAFVGTAPLSGEYPGYYVGRVEIGNIFGVNADSKDIELACKFLDFAMSDPCQSMYQWGIEGESYTIDASGIKTYTEKASDNDWLQQLGINPAFVLPAQQSVVSTDALVADWHAEINKQQEQYVQDPWPFIYATTEESDIVSTYMTDIQTYVDENAAAFVTGSKSLDEFEGYLSGLDSLNLASVLEAKQTQYSRYQSALKK